MLPRASPMRSWLARAGASLGRALLRWSERIEPKPKIDVIPELRARFPGAPEPWLQAIAERLAALGELGIEMPLQAVAPPVTRLRAVPREEPAAAHEALRRERAEIAWPAAAPRAPAAPVEYAPAAAKSPERAAPSAVTTRKPLLRPILFRLPQRAKPAAALAAKPSPRPARPVLFSSRAEAARPRSPAFAPETEAAPEIGTASFEPPTGPEQVPAGSVFSKLLPSRGAAAPVKAALTPAPVRRSPEFIAPAPRAVSAADILSDGVTAAPATRQPEQRPPPPAPEWPALPEQHLRPQDSSAAARVVEFRARLERLRREQAERLWNG